GVERHLDDIDAPVRQARAHEAGRTGGVCIDQHLLRERVDALVALAAAAVEPIGARGVVPRADAPVPGLRAAVLGTLLPAEFGDEQGAFVLAEPDRRAARMIRIARHTVDDRALEV